MTRNFERRYDSKAGGPAADDNANVVLTKLSTRNCVSTDSHRLGQGRVFRCKTIRYFKQVLGAQQKALCTRPVKVIRVANNVHTRLGWNARHRHNMCPGRSVWVVFGPYSKTSAQNSCPKTTSSSGL